MNGQIGGGEDIMIVCMEEEAFLGQIEAAFPG